MKIAELTGQIETHLAPLNGHTLLHKKVLSPFIALQKEAKQAGFNLQVASGFRHFERQRLIWNNKFSGKSQLLDMNESPLISEQLCEMQKLYAILHWSALPGASRHHWGTDFDIYDPDLIPEGKKLQLTCDEYSASGYFFELSQWLTENMGRFNFYRPYHTYQGGVAAEPWHLSYHPIADDCLALLTPAVIRDLIIDNKVLGESLILAQLPMIYDKYICNINQNRG